MVVELSHCVVWYAPSLQASVGWLMNGATKRSGSTLLAVPGWRITQTADLDGEMARLTWCGLTRLPGGLWSG